MSYENFLVTADALMGVCFVVFFLVLVVVVDVLFAADDFLREGDLGFAIIMVMLWLW